MGTWLHIVLTQNYQMNISSLYANNMLVCEHSGTVPTLTTPHLNFGSRYDFSAVTCCNMIGTLDDFGIWYRVLTATEITELYDINTAAPELLQQTSTTASPNPTNGNLRLTNVPQATTILLVDATGRTVLTTYLQQGRDAVLDLSSYPAGLYLVRAGERSFNVVRE